MNTRMLRQSDPSSDLLSKVFSIHYGSLVHFANKLVNNLEEAKDIVSDTFINAFGRKSLETEWQVKAYLYVSVRNGCFDYLKIQKRRGGPPVDINELPGLQAPETPISTAHALLRATCLEFLIEEIKNMPGESGEVMRLHFLKHMKLTEIAKALVVNDRTVRQLKFKAMIKLREKVRQYPRFRDLLSLLAFISLYQLVRLVPEIIKKIFLIFG